MTFKALLASKTGDTISTNLVDFKDEDLMPGDVTVAVEYSTVNYKDAMALSGRSPVIRQFPLIPGIDFAGVVEASTYPGIAAGDRVLANGWGLSQTHHGGFAQKARVSGDWLVKVPEVFSTRDAMAIGTAGYTAMLSVLALEHGGLTPEHGDILVTGANGGAGSVAIALLSSLGYRVIASTGRLEESDYLRALGAADVIDRHTLSEAGAPIAKERWAGAIDSVGSHTLANVLAQTRYRGVVAAFGLAQGADLPASVLPFILRNV
ncbi:MAG: MDR family oxidoreductase, partial [Variovorax sp.]|nr:MDR family oxidoreductase [Variovorax sp.]